MVQLRMKALFSKPRRQRAMDAAMRRALSLAGAFTRRRAGLPRFGVCGMLWA